MVTDCRPSPGGFLVPRPTQARFEVCKEAAEQGIPVVNRWSCQFLPAYKTKHGHSSGSRESHKALDGQVRPAGEAFQTIWGNALRYPGDPTAPAREVINCHCVLVPDVAGADKSVSALPNQRAMANGLRSQPRPLTEEEISFVCGEAEAIGIDKNVIKFNCSHQTLYDDVSDTIKVVGDVFPDLTSAKARDTMNVRAVLSHEYYGHRQYRNTRVPPQAWNDEFRASYRAALSSPGLTDEDRQLLMRDALDRASEAGVTIHINSKIRKVLYGF